MTNHTLPKLTLYHRPGCPYCIITLSAIDRLELDIELRNIYSNAEYLQKLITGGGKRQVPCLHIEGADGQSEWLYESKAIIQYLNEYKQQVIKVA